MHVILILILIALLWPALARNLIGGALVGIGVLLVLALLAGAMGH
jgi:hypothetical protein